MTVSQLQPQGIRFAVKDAPGISLVAFHYSVNAPLLEIAAGQHAIDIRAKTGDEWVHEDRSVTLHPGDQVNYWYYVLDGTGGHNIINKQWTVQGSHGMAPTTTTTTTTTTSAAPSHETRPATTSAHATVFVDKSTVNHNTDHTSGPKPAASSTGTDTTTTGTLSVSSSSSETDSKVTPHTSSQVASGGGSCGCTGNSISPPGSELTCTTFPCMIFEDEFDSLNLDVWEHEITAGGGGNWEFQVYTNNRTNSYVRDGKLFIKPKSLVAGSQPGDVCTGNAFWGCRRDGNPDHIIDPIQSARLRSSRGFNFRYGKVEVRAKMPKGDWIWPAIWLLPLRNKYGKWPASGEIDIVEARGNADYHDDKGNDQSIKNAGSTLHFGSDFWHNKWPKAHGESISIDGDEVLNVTPQTTMWEYGGLDQDGVENPWTAGSKMAPFDQEFFLIMNVAVGGTAFFPDKFRSATGKPWSDTSDFATRDYWNARDQWYPTWHPDQNNGEDAAMQVDYIRVWKLKP
ncbi:BGBP-like protein [Mya arenaria]|uniref:BGBP-like protein n=1 Tax=Mya arenaria TaxID=6604 RepID=A0ABY7DY65_MYAAR|nr:BGBP-like protein [Mya arenaria]